MHQWTLIEGRERSHVVHHARTQAVQALNIVSSCRRARCVECARAGEQQVMVPFSRRAGTSAAATPPAELLGGGSGDEEAPQPPPAAAAVTAALEVQQMNMVAVWVCRVCLELSAQL
jgi:hypothetical protein